MGTQTFPGVFLFVLIVVASTQTGIAEPRKCSSGCHGSTRGGSFQYNQGQTYIYNVEGITATTVPGAQGDGVKLQIKATAELSILAECNQLLKLKNLQITGPDAKVYGNLKALEANPVRFNFQDGRIDKEVCAVEEDSNMALNIKKAILSLFQVTASRSDSVSSAQEWDVFGSCPTHFSFIKSGDVVTVTKTRNLNKCYHREDVQQGHVATRYQFKSDTQSSPLLDSSLKVEQKIKNGIMISAVSHETYLYRPFANRDAGAKTTVETKITLVSNKAKNVNANVVTSAHSIVFEAPHSARTTSSSVKTIIAALHKARDSMKQTVGPTSAHEFANLVSVLRHSTKEDILSVYGQVKAGAGFDDKKSAKKLFLDALFETGTGDSVQVAVELLKSHEISKEHARLWYLSFAFVGHVTLPTLSAVSTLLDEANLPVTAYLGIGSIAGRYCRHHKCEDVAQFNELLGKLASHLGDGCKTTSREQEDVVIAVLKALHNIHHLNNNVAETVAKCGADASLPSRLRVAALETFQSDACRSKLKKAASEILNNRQEDSEIRIKAYLALVECPSGKVANNIKALLESETINQVGSFIVSHLRNLRASTHPGKAYAKEQLGLVKSRKSFPIDLRKFSHNYELSYILDGLNVGTTVESNVIYSQKSYIPRSVSLNLTTEVFGHSLNLFEIGARAENLDRVVESYFGPKGYFNSHDLEEMLTAGKESFSTLTNKIKERFQKTMRSKRSVSHDEIEQVRERAVQSLGVDHGDNHVDLDLSLKMLGSELSWLNYHGDTHEFKPENIIDKIFDYADNGIKKAKNIDVDWKHHMTFMESEVTYPTGVGLPLKLVATGSSAVHLKVNGNVDIPAIIRDPKNAHLKLEVLPSAAVEVIGLMVIDAYAVESGLKVASTLHTSTGSDITIQSTDGHGFDINFGLPIKKQDIISLNTEVLSTIQEPGQVEVDTPLQFNTLRKDYHGCFDTLSGLVGVTMCGVVAFPWDPTNDHSALFPLNGPSKLALSIESDDVSSYHIRAVLNNKGPKKTLELLFDTPNSQTNRKLALFAEAVTEPSKVLKVTVSTPWKEVKGEASIIDTATEHSLNAKLSSDNEEYVTKIGVKISGDSNHQTYSPILEYKAPGHSENLVVRKGTKGSPAKSTTGFQVEGSVTVDKLPAGRKYTFNDVVLVTPEGTFELDGFVSKDGNTIVNDLKLTHGGEQNIIKGSLQKLGPMNYKVSAEVQCSQHPDQGIAIKWEFQKEKDHLENNFVLIHGKDLNSDDSRFSLSQSAKYKFEDVNNFDLSFKNQATYPLLGFEVKLDGAATQKSLSYDFEAAYDTHKIGSELSFKTGIHKPRDYEIEFEVQALTNSLKLESKREIVSNDKSTFTNKLELHPGGVYEFNAEVTYNCEPDDINTLIKAILKVHGQPNDYKLDVGLTYNPQVLDSHAKLGAGSTNYIDVGVKLNKGANPSGNAKIFLKNYIDGAAQFKYNNGKGSSTLNVDILKTGRKIKGTGDLALTGTIYDASVDLYWNADKDPKQHLHLQTNSDIKENDIDSKNTIVILDYKTVFNVKGTLTGKFSEGQIVGNADLTLPNGRHLTGTLDRTLHVRPANIYANVKVELADYEVQGSQPKKVTLDYEVKDLDTKHCSFDGHGKLSLYTAKGDDLTVSIVAKNVPQREERIIEFQGELQGSLVGNKPHTLRLNSEVSHTQVTYKAHGGVGNDASIDITGKVNKGLDGKMFLHEDNVFTADLGVENVLEIKLPIEKLRQVHVTTHFNMNVNPTKCETKFDNILITNGANTYKVSGELDHNDKAGSGKIVVTLPNEEPRTVAGTWSEDFQNEVMKDAGSLTYNWAGNKELKFTWDGLAFKDLSTVELHMTAATPIDKLRHLELTLKNKLTRGEHKAMETAIMMSADDKKINLHSKLTEGICKALPNMDITIEHPDGKSRIFVDLHKTDADLKGDVELAWAAKGGGNLKMNIDATYESINNFNVKVEADSKALNIKKWNILVGTKPTKGGNNVVISATSEGKNVLAGKLSHRTEERDNFFQYSANGNVKLHEETLPISIEVAYTTLTPIENSEAGAQLSIKSNVGDRSFTGIQKFTNREVHLGGTTCISKVKCAQVELQSKFKVADLAELHHELQIIVDLKGTEVNEHLSLRADTVRKGHDFESTSEINLRNQEHTTYKSRVYLNDKEGGVVLTLPTRVIALEAHNVFDYDKQSKNIKFQFESNFWLDKDRQPNVKTGVFALYNLNPGKDGVIASGELKVIHPSLGKDMVLKGRTHYGAGHTLLDSTIDIDIFSRKNQKIVIESKVLYNKLDKGLNITWDSSIQSKGQGLDVISHGSTELSPKGIGFISIINYKDDKQVMRDAGVTIDLSHEDILISVKAPSSELLRIEGKVNSRQDHTIKTESTISIVGMDTTVINADVSLPPSFLIVVHGKDKPSKRLEVSGTFDLLRVIGMQANTIVDSQKKELFKFFVALSDDQFLETDINWSIDNIKPLMNFYHKEIVAFLKQIKVVVADFSKELSTELTGLISALRKAQPNIKSVLASYQQQLEALKKEFLSDKAIKELSDCINNSLSGVIHAVTEALQKLTETLHKLVEHFEKLQDKVKEAANKLVPQITESYNKILTALTNVAEKVLQQTVTIFNKVMDELKKHEDEIKQLTILGVEFVQDVGGIIGKSIIQIRKEFQQFYIVLMEQVKALPAYSVIQEKYEEILHEISEMIIPEQTWGMILDILTGIKETLPTEELKDLVTTIEVYIQKKINKEKVNDVAELQYISKKAVKALQSFLTLLKVQSLDLAEPDSTGILGYKLPVTVAAILHIPQLFSASFSSLNSLMSGDIPSLSDYYHTYRPDYDPIDWLPPYETYGLLIDSHHFFTFDNRHFTFKGTCSYILAQDVVDGNFSIVLNLEGGKMKSLQLSDLHDNFELFADHTLKVNGADSEFPAESGDLKAWRRYDSVNLKTKAGVHIIGDIDTSLYTIHMSGFYFDKTRGLMGTLNNEPWDDFMLPNGQITTKVNDFGNAWKVNSNCADVKGSSHHDHQMPHVQECSEKFTGSSSLSGCFGYVNPSSFREACDHITADASSADAKKAAACSIATAYSIACLEEDIEVNIPAHCVSCPVVGSSNIGVGETVSLRVPQRAADIILVVEQVTSNAETFKELVTPLITTLTNDLKSKGITDVHFSLVGFGGKDQEWPVHYTSGGKLSFDGKIKNIKFGEGDDPIPFDNWAHKIEWVIHQIEIELGYNKIGEAVSEVIQYPYRAGAAKTVIGVFGQSCETSLLPAFIQQLRLQLAQKYYREIGGSVHVISPVEGIQMKDNKQSKQVVGFDAEHVYTLGDAKKKVLEGNSELRKSFDYKSTACIQASQNTYGATFVSQNFIEAKASARKQFLQVVSHRIADTLSTELYEDCTCVISNGHTAQSHCKVTGRKEREQLVLKKGVKV